MALFSKPKQDIIPAIDPEIPPNTSPPVLVPKPQPTTPKGLLWCPFAKKTGVPMKDRGEYRKGYPEGAVIHFTAGQWGTSALEAGVSGGFLYLLIDEMGLVYQSNSLNKWGDHVGDSEWSSLGTWLSKYLVGIEIACGGEVTKQIDGTYKTWFGKIFPPDQVRYVDKKDNILNPGYYQKYTQVQEDSLIKLLRWLKSNNPDIFSFDYVLGHDEVCRPRGRKLDPGGSLSKTMPEFREYLKGIL